jgi:sterol desaturase/sphingolipid hydroxylase (fatty acid hydroxylase superfamily)
VTYWTVPLLFLAGLAWWTLLEYLLHRFMFHRAGSRHLKHHARLDDRRLALAPLSSALGGIAIHAIVFIGLFGLGAGLSLLAGVVTGYLAYEWVHWATHYRVPHSHVLKALRRHHMIHHHAQHDARFGVTTPFWDWVFRTLPPAPGRGRNSAMRGGREHLSP